MAIKFQVEGDTEPQQLVCVEHRDYFDVIAKDEANVYYLLYVQYQTGDSFNTYNAVTWVDLYTSRDIAIENALRIRQHHDDNDGRDGLSIELLDDERNEVTTYVSWIGFFETLQNIRVQPMLNGICNF